MAAAATVRRRGAIVAVMLVSAVLSLALAACGDDSPTATLSSPVGVDTTIGPVAASSEPSPTAPTPPTSEAAADTSSLPVETTLGAIPTTAPTTPAAPATRATVATVTSAPRPATTVRPAGAPPTGKRCLVKLHGLTGRGQPTQDDGTLTLLQPQGNGVWSGGGFGWIYYSDDRFPGTGYDQARASIVESLNAVGNCGQIIVYGFSNGGAMVAKLYCRGETFGGKMVGYIVDDPVTDAGVDGCAPAAGVKVAVFHSRFMNDQVNDSTTCRPGNTWICENNVRYRLADYDARIGVTGVIAAVEHDAGPYQPVIDGWWR
jgi:hypothetical protein